MQSSYFANRNNRNHKLYPGNEPAYPDHLPARKQAVVGHFAAHNRQRYVITTEEVVQLRRAEDHHSLSPPPARKEALAGRAAGAAKFQPPPIYDQPMGPARINFGREKTPPPRNSYYDSNSEYGKISDDESNEYSDDDRWPIRPGYLYGRDERPEENYKKENNQRMGFAPHAYTIPNRDQTPKKKGHDGPNRNYGYAPPVLKIIPQIKTIVGDPEFAKKGPENPQPGHREVIDSTEARKRYGRPSPRRGGPHVEEKYTGTIDSKEAARRYKGVFVTD